MVESKKEKKKKLKYIQSSNAFFALESVKIKRQQAEEMEFKTSVLDDKFNRKQIASTYQSQIRDRFMQLKIKLIFYFR